uniref:Uncharacterized protein n=1 Tax=Anguilla anguilla TaxID=7936 RepID=A0A0E9PVT9_ANGAN
MPHTFPFTWLLGPTNGLSVFYIFNNKPGKMQLQCRSDQSTALPTYDLSDVRRWSS